MTLRNVSRVSPQIETLEGRQLFAAGFLVQYQSFSWEGTPQYNVLTLTGTNAAEQATLTLAQARKGAQLVLSQKTGSMTFDVRNIDTINILTLGGNDNITFVKNGMVSRYVSVQVDLGDGDDTLNVKADMTFTGGPNVTDYFFSGYGGRGKDKMFVTESFATGDVAFDGGEGNDTITGGSGDDYLNGGGNNDFISGKDGNDFLYGGDGNDAIFGGNGDDIFHQSRHNDYMEGGAGNDVLNFGGLRQNDAQFGYVATYTGTFHGGAGFNSIGFVDEADMATYIVTGVNHKYKLIFSGEKG